jgi:hypothetical protein
MASLRELEVAAGIVEIRSIRAGERVFVEGDVADWSVFVIEGSFQSPNKGLINSRSKCPGNIEVASLAK